MRKFVRFALLLVAVTTLALALFGASAFADQAGPGPNAPVADQVGPGA